MQYAFNILSVLIVHSNIFSAIRPIVITRFELVNAVQFYLQKNVIRFNNGNAKFEHEY